MEYSNIGGFPEGDWESLSKMFSVEDLEFTPHFDGQFSNTTFEANNSDDHQSLFHHHHTMESLINGSDHLQYLSQQESCYSTSPNSGTQDSNSNTYLSHHHINSNINNNDDNFSVPNFLMEQCNNNNNNATTPNPDVHLKRTNVYDDEDDKSNQNPKKKPRVQRSNKKNGKSQAMTKPARNGKVEEENSNTSSYSSDDDNGGDTAVVNLNTKARASRGSATDPQSLYARKRRERINERLRILQNLVPNGTKVDISTMLEEAVQYVQFLQLQIKLLSSDDMWMYAPIAYNGMDIGLNKKLSQLV